MNTFSHIMLGDYILEAIYDRHGIVLHRKSFLLGNILPDCQLSFMSRPHQPEYWQDYINGQVARLLREKTGSRTFGRRYSLRLGIICHFYTDFFCYAHNTAFSGTSREHLKYEWDIHRRIKRGIAPVPLASLDEALCRGMTPHEIHEGFARLHREYTVRIGPSERRDIRYTLRACIDAVERIALCSAAGSTKRELLVPAPVIPPAV
jgi:hypothetical protein